MNEDDHTEIMGWYIEVKGQQKWHPLVVKGLKRSDQLVIIQEAYYGTNLATTHNLIHHTPCNISNRNEPIS